MTFSQASQYRNGYVCFVRVRTSARGRYLPVNILDSGRSGRLVWVCAEFQSIGLANRFELVYLDKPGVTTYGWGASLVRMPAHGPFPGLDAVS
jgi:hypothetical protein